MASTLTVDNIVGATTAAKVKLPAGSVLQTVFAQAGAAVTTNVSDLANPVDCLSATITPKYSSSKILVIASHVIGGGADGVGANMFLKKGGTLLPTSEIGGDTAGLMVYGIGRSQDHSAHHTFHHLNSPNTTSATTYTVAMGRYGGSSIASYTMNGTKDKNTLTLMEISQ